MLGLVVIVVVQGWYCSGDLRPYRPISFHVEFSTTNPMPYRLDYEYWC